VHGLAKRFPNGTVAIQSVDLTVDRGSVHGLIGANGAGKSTLVKIVSGALKRSGGEVRWRGSSVDWASPLEAMSAGVHTVYQNTPLVPDLSVLENVFLGERGDLFRDRRALREEFFALADRVGYIIDPDTLVARLPIGQRQMVAILQSLAAGSALVIMDEPTAALSSSERELVFSTVRRLSTEEKISFLYVSHLLDEVLTLTDHLTVLRDGKVSLESATREVTGGDLVNAIVARPLNERANVPKLSAKPRSVEVALRASNVTTRGISSGLSFDLHKGEVLGVAGLLGSGRSELLHILFRSDSHAKGTVTTYGKRLQRSPVAAVRAGLALVPEDRDAQGLLGRWDIAKNISLPHLRELSSASVFPSARQEARRAREAMIQLNIKADSEEALVGELSGGNAQKVVFGKWLKGAPAVLLLDEPTAGVDVGAKSEILELVREFARQGGSAIVVSSEFSELLAIADRILVMRKGDIVAERISAATTEEELVALVSGIEYRRTI